MLRLAVRGLLDLIWPPRTACLLCLDPLPANLTHSGARPHSVCPMCWRSMLQHCALPRCSLCTRPLELKGQRRCAACREGSPFGRVFSLGLHEGLLREAIHHLKFNGRTELGEPLGRQLAATVRGGFDCVVPVPLHRARERQRGYNQAALIARGISSQLTTPLTDRILVRRRSTFNQAKLGRADRLHNLEHAFTLISGVSYPWKGRAVLLVDDVLTTGATAAAAASVLRESGAQTVALAVLAVSATPVIG